MSSTSADAVYEALMDRVKAYDRDLWFTLDETVGRRLGEEHSDGHLCTYAECPTFAAIAAAGVHRGL